MAWQWPSEPHLHYFLGLLILHALYGGYVAFGLTTRVAVLPPLVASAAGLVGFFGPWSRFPSISANVRRWFSVNVLVTGLFHARAIAATGIFAPWDVALCVAVVGTTLTTLASGVLAPPWASSRGRIAQVGLLANILVMGALIATWRRHGTPSFGPLLAASAVGAGVAWLRPLGAVRACLIDSSWLAGPLDPALWLWTKAAPDAVARAISSLPSRERLLRHESLVRQADPRVTYSAHHVMLEQALDGSLIAQEALLPLAQPGSSRLGTVLRDRARGPGLTSASGATFPESRLFRLALGCHDLGEEWGVQATSGGGTTTLEQSLRRYGDVWSLAARGIAPLGPVVLEARTAVVAGELARRAGQVPRLDALTTLRENLSADILRVGSRAAQYAEERSRYATVAALVALLVYGLGAAALLTSAATW